MATTGQKSFVYYYLDRTCCDMTKRPPGKKVGGGLTFPGTPVDSEIDSLTCHHWPLDREAQGGRGQTWSLGWYNYNTGVYGVHTEGLCIQSLLGPRFQANCGDGRTPELQGC